MCCNSHIIQCNQCNTILIILSCLNTCTYVTLINNVFMCYKSEDNQFQLKYVDDGIWNNFINPSPNYIKQNPSGESNGPSVQFVTFHGTQGLITIFVRARNWSLTKAKWIQSLSSYLNSLQSILKVSCHLSLNLSDSLSLSQCPAEDVIYFSALPLLLYAPVISVSSTWSSWTVCSSITSSYQPNFIASLLELNTHLCSG